MQNPGRVVRDSLLSLLSYTEADGKIRRTRMALSFQPLLRMLRNADIATASFLQPAKQ